MEVRRRVGIDARPFLNPQTGVRRYVAEMCTALGSALPDVDFIAYAPYPVQLPAECSHWEVRIDHEQGTGSGHTFWWLKRRLGRLCQGDKLDAFWATTTFLPWLPAGVCSVSTVYDMVHRVNPSSMRATALVQHRLWLERDIRAADAIVTISEGTARRVLQYTGRVVTSVARPGVNPMFRRPDDDEIARVRVRYNLRRSYVLSVGTWEPRKNLSSLVEAMVQLRRAGKACELDLVLVGCRGWKDSGLSKAVGDQGHEHVRTLGQVPDADLPALYGGSALFAYPSRYEGFGLPVMEASACGARVLASDIPELREAGGAEVTYVEPTVAGLASGIARALSQTAPQRATASPRWSDGASQLARVLVADHGQ